MDSWSLEIVFCVKIGKGYLEEVFFHIIQKTTKNNSAISELRTSRKI